MQLLVPSRRSYRGIARATVYFDIAAQGNEGRLRLPDVSAWDAPRLVLVSMGREERCTAQTRDLLTLK
jgi:hypothetical protein